METYKNKIVTLYFLFIAIHVTFIWIFPHFPSQDGPSHLYNLVILHDLINGGEQWGKFFEHNLHPVPNLGFFIFTFPFFKFFNPLVIEKIFLSFYIIFFASAFPFFLKSFNSPLFPHSFLVFPALLNFNLFMGFYSYIISIPFFLVFFALSWKIQNSPNLQKFFLFNFFSILIFYIHLVSFGFYILSIISISISKSKNLDELVKAFLKLLLLLSPCLLNFAYYLIMFSTQTNVQFPDFSFLFNYKHYIFLYSDLITFTLLTYPYYQILTFLPFSFLLLVSIYSSVKEIFFKFRHKLEIKDLQIQKTFFFLISSLTLIYFISPSGIGETDTFNQRIPIIIFIFIVPLIRFPKYLFLKIDINKFILTFIFLFFICNSIGVFIENHKIDYYLSGLKVDIPKNAFIISYKKDKPQYTRIDSLLHASGYYAINKYCIDLGNYHANLYNFFVRFKNLKNNSENLRGNNLKYILTDNNQIDYLISWDLPEMEIEQIRFYFSFIYKNNKLAIWKKLSPLPAPSQKVEQPYGAL